MKGFKMKILNLINTFFPEYTGTSVRTYNLLSKLDAGTTLITRDKTLNGDLIPIKEEKFGKILVKRVSLVQNNPPHICKYPPLRYKYSLRNIEVNKNFLINKAKKEEFNVVHGHGFEIFGQSAFQLSKLSKKPLVMEMHIARPQSTRDKFYDFYLLNISKFLDFSDSILVLTNAFKEYISNYYDLNVHKVRVVPNGVDSNFFNKTNNNDIINRLKDNLGLNTNVIMYSGYMDDVNGINFVLDIIPSLIQEKDDISFLFIGHGPEQDKIISLSKKYSQIKYVKTVEYNKMPLYYQLCDLFILPRPSTLSTELITPLKLLEAMAMERTVLGSNVGGISEVIKNGKNGYLFEKGNSNDFKNKLQEILNTNNNKISKNARKTIINDYTWEKSSLILEKIYENLI
jgi:glycosyltransferase involved in cell wall biosynthesis